MNDERHHVGYPKPSVSTGLVLTTRFGRGKGQKGSIKSTNRELKSGGREKRRGERRESSDLSIRSPHSSPAINNSEQSETTANNNTKSSMPYANRATQS